ncbi:hypothetical protein MJO29_003670 [Puccinia striiformis f. sp. tritici]|uniref:VHS domain-containing protein n=1 Tax=Puccinia striiformis f. sp. tritici PST-78 TaxID=1165861 RepID=A0A0L0V7P7_9BASI|nr:hypothetical protein Pst134EA_006767 [Puccinia striiformis f. sp. tritici]KAI9608910.1 hypothetical protein H4Q26_005104 [Puccinia striiformis f. sp. tritici PST-130]KNE95303.1 hypothetical protein PSTG_11387 [Puccinia striiformis f. sp. tritici PST-78]KAH9459702.1 hypothetical protein Pst134EB_007931 [Puccinia striiformis f. sp. tritici]KAH9469480.1 hypothetical protein Pst134EA_006767 [Puccinia striiformis f. sp. tritici]KAI7963243.1 hypothetical protein MJO29_003670 [Puccinia striiformis
MPSYFTDPSKAFSKPVKSSVTDWIARICGADALEQNDLTGFLIELVESINLQPTGPEEASRAIRKQLKHGRPSRQAKALTVLDALVLNGGDRFKSTFADARLVECLKGIVSDSRSDPLVKRRLLTIMEDWERVYGSDPKMIAPAGLLKLCGGKPKHTASITSSNKSKISLGQRSMLTGVEKTSSVPSVLDPQPLAKSQLKIQEKEDKKRKQKLKSSRIDQRYRTELVLPPTKTDPDLLMGFDLSKERPRILEVVASASQNANNLVNRLQLISPDQVANDRSLKSLAEKVKSSQKTLTRYIQTVSEHDTEGEYMGTLLNTNGQVVTALELYEDLTTTKPREGESAQVMNSELTDGFQKAEIIPTPHPSHEPNLFDDSHCASDGNHLEQRRSPVDDLLGLDFSSSGLNSLGSNLPAPLIPNFIGNGGGGQQPQSHFDPGTLSDYSDGDDSSSLSSTTDNTTDETNGSTTVHKPTTNNPFHQFFNSSTHPPLSNHLVSKDSLDPFADPFADSNPSLSSSTSNRNNSLITSAVI